MTTSRRPACVVLGASGFVGQHLLGSLAGDWRAPVVAVTRQSIDVPTGVTVRQAALESPTLLRDLPSGAIVINLVYSRDAGAAGNLALADRVAAVCDAIGAPRLVHVSTATVAGLTGLRQVTETTPCRPATPYQREKLAVEERLRGWARRGRGLVVLRPTAVFGVGGLALRKMADDLVRRSWMVNYAKSCLSGARPLNLVSVETVVSAIRHAAETPQAVEGGLYLVSEDDAPGNTYRGVETTLRTSLGLPAYPLPPAPLPPALLTGALTLAGRLKVDADARYLPTRLHEAGCRPPRPFSETLKAYCDALAAEIRAGGAS